MERRLSQLPDMEVLRGPQRSKHSLSLNTVHQMLEVLALTVYPLPIIQVVGSKGKGTVAWMLNRLLQAHGWRTGMYQSPHLQSRKERVLLNGDYASLDLWTEVLDMLWETFDPVERQISRFELETVLALEMFVRADLDVVILEAGLGGKKDATSAIAPDVVGITSMELEHTEILGPRIEDIAYQKAGGIRVGTPVVSAPLPAPAMRIVASICEKRNAPLFRVADETSPENAIQLQDVSLDTTGCDFTLRSDKWTHGEAWPVRLSLLGPHNPTLAALSVGIVGSLLESLGQDFEPSSLKSLQELSIPGRLQHIHNSPSVILDVAHTPNSVASSLQACQQHGQRPPHAVLLGLNSDKRAAELLQRLGEQAQHLCLVPNPGPRGLGTDELQSILTNIQWSGRPPQVHTFSSVEQGWQHLTALLQGDHLGLALGSFGLIGELQQLLHLNPLPTPYKGPSVRTKAPSPLPMSLHPDFAF